MGMVDRGSYLSFRGNKSSCVIDILDVECTEKARIDEGISAYIIVIRRSVLLANFFIFSGLQLSALCAFLEWNS